MVGIVRVTRVVLSAIVLVGASLAIPVPVDAHCPGTVPPGGRNYASGSHNLLNQATGVRANIHYTNPTVCQNGQADLDFTLEGVTLCPEIPSLCQGWVQTGWIKIGMASPPIGYCEYAFVGGPTDMWTFPISGATHEYRWLANGNVWQCSLDNVLKFAIGLDFLSGGWVNAQGENNSNHTQIGRNSPARLLFSSASFRQGINWNSMNVNLGPVNAPYGRDEPGLGQFRNWTNAH